MILVNGGTELRLETRASIADHQPALLPLVKGNAVVQFIEVESLDQVPQELASWKLVVPLRTTPYGMREIFLQDHAGYLVGFAEQA